MQKFLTRFMRSHPIFKSMPLNIESAENITIINNLPDIEEAISIAVKSDQ